MSEVMKWTSSLYVTSLVYIKSLALFMQLENIFLELGQYGAASSTHPSGMMSRFQSTLLLVFVLPVN
jgi:hypothetical protein